MEGENPCNYTFGRLRQIVLPWIICASFLAIISSNAFAILGPDDPYCIANPGAPACGGLAAPPSTTGQQPAGSSTPQGLPAQVWMADLAVGLTANKDLRNQVIAHQMTVTNLGSSDARELEYFLAWSNALPAGLKILSITSRDALCGVYEPIPGLPYVKCSQPALPVRGISTVSILTANLGYGPRKATV
jgi:hypothetical protein